MSHTDDREREKKPIFPEIISDSDAIELNLLCNDILIFLMDWKTEKLVVLINN